MLRGRILYRFLVGVARFTAPILANGTGKISRGLKGKPHPVAGSGPPPGWLAVPGC